MKLERRFSLAVNAQVTMKIANTDCPCEQDWIKIDFQEHSNAEKDDPAQKDIIDIGKQLNCYQIESICVGDKQSSVVCKGIVNVQAIINVILSRNLFPTSKNAIFGGNMCDINLLKGSLKTYLKQCCRPNGISPTLIHEFALEQLTILRNMLLPTLSTINPNAGLVAKPVVSAAYKTIFDTIEALKVSFISLEGFREFYKTAEGLLDSPAAQGNQDQHQKNQTSLIKDLSLFFKEPNSQDGGHPALLSVLRKCGADSGLLHDYEKKIAEKVLSGTPLPESVSGIVASYVGQ